MLTPLPIVQKYTHDFIFRGDHVGCFIKQKLRNVREEKEKEERKKKKEKKRGSHFKIRRRYI